MLTVAYCSPLPPPAHLSLLFCLLPNLVIFFCLPLFSFLSVFHQLLFLLLVSCSAFRSPFLSHPIGLFFKTLTAPFPPPFSDLALPLLLPSSSLYLPFLLHSPLHSLSVIHSYYSFLFDQVVFPNFPLPSPIPIKPVFSIRLFHYFP